MSGMAAHYPTPLSLSLSKAARNAGVATLLRQAQHERTQVWEVVSA
jgi:hypothetical protein